MRKFHLWAELKRLVLNLHCTLHRLEVPFAADNHNNFSRLPRLSVAGKIWQISAVVLEWCKVRCSRFKNRDNQYRRPLVSNRLPTLGPRNHAAHPARWGSHLHTKNQATIFQRVGLAIFIWPLSRISPQSVIPPAYPEGHPLLQRINFPKL